MESEAKEKQEMVTLKSLSDLTGFPVEMIKEELFNESPMKEDESVSLDELRKAMVSFLDKTMLEDEKSLN